MISMGFDGNNCDMQSMTKIPSSDDKKKFVENIKELTDIDDNYEKIYNKTSIINF